jgi:hypothetical protein
MAYALFNPAYADPLDVAMLADGKDNCCVVDKAAALEAVACEVKDTDRALCTHTHSCCCCC